VNVVGGSKAQPRLDSGGKRERVDIPSEIKEEMGALNDWLSILLKGDDMHPLHLSFCGADPGEGWKYNRFRHLNYYQFLIPNLNFLAHQMVALWIKYNLNPALL
jgi:hypothetical protein